MGTGLIYAVIVCAWAAVLLPMWLRRHDDRTEAKQVEGFSRAMRVLARRSPPSAPARRYVVMPARPSVAEVHVTGPEIRRRGRRPAVAAGASRREVRTSVSDLLDAPETSPAEARPTRRTPAKARRPAPSAPRAAASLAARRRRTLLALVVVAVVVSGCAFVGLVPRYVVVPAVLVLLGFFVHLRGQARAASEATARRHNAARRTATRARRLDSSERIVAARLARRQGLEADAAAEVEELVDDGWAPRPMTLPTYVGKAKAPSYLREATWASFASDEGIGTADRPASVYDQVAEHDRSTYVASAADDAAALQLDDEFDDIFERRAVGD